MEEIIDFTPYILNDANMLIYLKYKLNENDESSNIEQKKSIYNKEKNVNKENIIIIPKEKDTLFWCYYIISNGDTKYEMLNNKNCLIAKQIKIEYIKKIRENKQLIKQYKFDTITNIESNLVNDNNINIMTAMTLFLIDKINIVFIKKYTYYELLINDNGPIYIIREIYNDSKYNKKYGFEMISKINMLDEIRSKLYKINSLNKPIKGISSYKVNDLIEIATKLAIETVNKDTGKNKTKNDLYESIIQYF